MICALCGHESEYLGGNASDSSGSFNLCHRDHTDGATCYEQVTRKHMGETFAERIETLKARKPVKAYKIGYSIPKPSRFDAELAQVYAEGMGMVKQFIKNMEVLGYDDLKIKVD